jgi:hypothetical protein
LVGVSFTLWGVKARCQGAAAGYIAELIGVPIAAGGAMPYRGGDFARQPAAADLQALPTRPRNERNPILRRYLRARNRTNTAVLQPSALSRHALEREPANPMPCICWAF